VPYANVINEYLQRLIRNSPESEISKEVIYRANYNMVRKIITKGEYDFDNPTKLDDKILKPKTTKIDAFIMSQYLPNANQSHNTLITVPLEIGHNVENYILYKQIKKKKKFNTRLNTINEGKSLYPFTYYLDNKRSMACRSENRQMLDTDD